MENSGCEGPQICEDGIVELSGVLVDVLHCFLQSVSISLDPGVIVEWHQEMPKCRRHAPIVLRLHLHNRFQDVRPVSIQCKVSRLFTKIGILREICVLGISELQMTPQDILDAFPSPG